MSVAPLGGSSTGGVYAPKKEPVYAKPSIDWSKFTEYAGLKPNDAITCTWSKEKVPVLNLESLISPGVNLSEVAWTREERRAPISLTFKTAVELVMRLISEKPVRTDGTVCIDYDDQSVLTKVVLDLSSVDNKDCEKFQPNLIRTEIPYPTSTDHVRFLLGTIIHMLYELGSIETYGLERNKYLVAPKQIS